MRPRRGARTTTTAATARSPPADDDDDHVAVEGGASASSTQTLRRARTMTGSLLRSVVKSDDDRRRAHHPSMPSAVPQRHPQMNRTTSQVSNESSASSESSSSSSSAGWRPRRSFGTIFGGRRPPSANSTNSAASSNTSPARRNTALTIAGFRWRRTSSRHQSDTASPPPPPPLLKDMADNERLSLMEDPDASIVDLCDRERVDAMQGIIEPVVIPSRFAAGKTMGDGWMKRLDEVDQSSQVTLSGFAGAAVTGGTEVESPIGTDDESEMEALRRRSTWTAPGSVEGSSDLLRDSTVTARQSLAIAPMPRHIVPSIIAKGHATASAVAATSPTTPPLVNDRPQKGLNISLLVRKAAEATPTFTGFDETQPPPLPRRPPAPKQVWAKMTKADIRHPLERSDRSITNLGCEDDEISLAMRRLRITNRSHTATGGGGSGHHLLFNHRGGGGGGSHRRRHTSPLLQQAVRLLSPPPQALLHVDGGGERRRRRIRSSNDAAAAGRAISTSSFDKMGRLAEVDDDDTGSESIVMEDIKGGDGPKDHGWWSTCGDDIFLDGRGPGGGGGGWYEGSILGAYAGSGVSRGDADDEDASVASSTRMKIDGMDSVRELVRALRANAEMKAQMQQSRPSMSGGESLPTVVVVVDT